MPLIAETGGQNAMIVDSSALVEQVVADVLESSFRSAGQRCSALRVLCVQDDVAPRVLEMLAGAMLELQVGDPGQLATDVGPVIDETARQRLEEHAERMAKEARLIQRVPLGADLGRGCFFAPQAFEIDAIARLEGEVFGPILHVVRFAGDRLDEVIDAINGTGYGLTLGVHSRIDRTIDRVLERARAGNIYVNRNMIGAVVGVQPFGGERLSGTGPKAGGPHYLPALRDRAHDQHQHRRGRRQRQPAEPRGRSNARRGPRLIRFAIDILSLPVTASRARWWGSAAGTSRAPGATLTLMRGPRRDHGSRESTGFASRCELLHSWRHKPAAMISLSAQEQYPRARRADDGRCDRIDDLARRTGLEVARAGKRKGQGF